MGEKTGLHPELAEALRRHQEFFQGKRNYLLKVSLNGFDISSWPMNNDSSRKVSEKLQGDYEVMKKQFVKEIPYDGMNWDRDFTDYYKNSITNRKIASSYRLDMKIGDDNLPAYFPYFGNAIHHIFFGGEMRFKGGTSYCTNIIEEAAEYEKVKFEIHNIWMERLGEGLDWCREQGDGVLLAALRGADGPLDMANGIMGNNLFTELMDDEENMQNLMKICKEACDAMCMLQKEHASMIQGGFVSGMGCLWMPEPMFGQISVDAAMMAGPKIYEKFEKPYLEELSEKYKGFLLHTHMLGWRMHDILAETKGVAIIRPSLDPNQPSFRETISSLLNQVRDKVLMLEVKKEEIEELVPFFVGKKAIFELQAEDKEDAWNQMERIHEILGE